MDAKAMQQEQFHETEFSGGYGAYGVACKVLKRVFDVALSALALIILSPLLLIN